MSTPSTLSRGRCSHVAAAAPARAGQVGLALLIDDRVGGVVVAVGVAVDLLQDVVLRLDLDLVSAL